jgi:hypothetical protein
MCLLHRARMHIAIAVFHSNPLYLHESVTILYFVFPSISILFGGKVYGWFERAIVSSL